MADYVWLRRPMRLFLGSLFTVIVYFSAYFSRVSTVVLICLSIVTRLSLTSIFIFFNDILLDRYQIKIAL